MNPRPDPTVCLLTRGSAHKLLFKLNISNIEVDDAVICALALRFIKKNYKSHVGYIPLIMEKWVKCQF